MSEWTLDIQDMSWVEHTAEEVDFVIEALELRGSERVLDLACGFGRHTLELARRGYAVVGVDITAEYIDHGHARASEEGLSAEFICMDVLDVTFREEFDVVLNMADGAIGYFSTEEENLKLFDVIADALKVGGKHVMGVCSAGHAIKHFPKRHWEAGSRSLSLADFHWNADTARMIYKGRVLKFGEVLEPFSNEFPDDGDAGIRLYTLEELDGILQQRGLAIMAAYGAYDTAVSASDDQLMLVVCSQKVGICA
ncbi:MAG TPA: class I SAM-dependent methyltransferase [Candidatus Hydrogenedentes bacterium]|nr:class I SAM-dependent methyltransferase [Candidatus Hydrogenedentota bacterium]HIJ74760.1 class I SAM-dependent methyltransferase [Candidatus Hydrogenedentota bacterium]